MQRIRGRSGRKCRWVAVMVLIGAIMFGMMACSDDNNATSQNLPPEADLPITPGGLFVSLIEGITSGIGSWSTEQALGWLLSLAGVDQDKITDEMKQQMQEMNEKLNEIISQLQIIEGELLDILKAIQMAEDAIINNNENLNIADDLNTITNQYANMTYFTVDVMGTAEGKAQAGQMADDILSGSGYDIDQRLYNIYAGIMGIDPGVNEGAMSAWTTTLIDKVGNEDLLNLYLSLEYYFGSLISTQSKGLSLMVEALHHRDDPITAGGVYPNDYPGTAKQYLEEKFTPWMEDETEEFLRCVDRLVVAGLDLRTDATTPVTMVSDDIRQIYFRADFLAAQVSSRHSFGLEARVIGEPDSIQAYVKNNVLVAANGNSMTIVPVGVKGHEEDVRLTGVEHWMYWPDGYTLEYMQWNWGQYELSSIKYEGFISFNSATNVAMVKFSLPEAQLGNYDVMLYATHETPFRDGQVALYDKDGQKVDQAVMNAHLYGSAVVTIRHGPTWAMGGTDNMDQDKRIDPTLEYSVTETPWAYTKARLLESNDHFYDSHATFSFFAWVSLPVLNGMESHQQQRVTCDAQIHGRQEGGLDKGDNYDDHVLLKWDGDVGETGGECFWDSAEGDHTLNCGPNGYVNYTGESISGEPASVYLEVGISNSVKGSEGQYLEVQAWVDHSYLFF